MKKWACFSIFEVNLEDNSALALKNIKASFIFLARLLVFLRLASSIALFEIILFLSDSNNLKKLFFLREQ